jgi:hypothetical protein
MTILLGKRLTDPAWCGCCGRNSSRVGVVETPDCFGDPMLWVCEACKPRAAFKVMDMNPLKLDKIESQAITKAAEAVASDILQVTLQKLWDCNVRDLSQLDEAAFNRVAASLLASPEISGVSAKLLVTFSNELRSLIAKEK